MKTYEEITAELRLKREKLDQHFRDRDEENRSNDVLDKLKELRERSERIVSSEKPQGPRA